jgi:outer membrane protein OmpA-like peptidoglycan-associated protein
MRIVLVLGLVARVAIAAPAAVRGNTIVVAGTIEYDAGKDTIRDTAYPLLDAVADVLARERKIPLVEIQVHTDARGDADWNLNLSQRRAEAVVAYLVSKGVASERLRAKGYGESQLIDRGHDARANARNRRTVFVIVPTRVTATVGGGIGGGVGRSVAGNASPVRLRTRRTKPIVS